MRSEVCYIFVSIILGLRQSNITIKQYLSTGYKFISAVIGEGICCAGINSNQDKMRTENGYTERSFYAYSVDRDMFSIKTDHNSDIKCIFLITPAKWLKEICFGF